VSLVNSRVGGAVRRAPRGLEREDLGSLLVGDVHRERSAVIAAQTLGTVAVGPVDSWLGRVEGRRWSTGALVFLILWWCSGEHVRHLDGSEVRGRGPFVIVTVVSHVFTLEGLRSFTHVPEDCGVGLSCFFLGVVFGFINNSVEYGGEY
jgi:hypothetical protein